MFQLGQIFTVSELVRHISRIVRLLAAEPQALLVIAKHGEKFVFVPAHIFESLLCEKLTADGASPRQSTIRDQVLSNNSAL